MVARSCWKTYMPVSSTVVPRQSNPTRRMCLHPTRQSKYYTPINVNSRSQGFWAILNPVSPFCKATPWLRQAQAGFTEHWGLCTIWLILHMDKKAEVGGANETRTFSLDWNFSISIPLAFRRASLSGKENICHVYILESERPRLSWRQFSAPS